MTTQSGTVTPDSPPEAADWLTGARMAANDALNALAGRATTDQLLHLAAVHALIDIAGSLRTITLLVSVADD